MVSNKIALVFPGQGSQYPQMGLKLYKTFSEARQVFDEVDDALNFKFSKIIFEGSEDDLKKTENTQPALMAVSVAILRCIEIFTGKKVSDFASILAGHSLGEYSALYASGAISLRDVSIILRKRGKFMAKAYPHGGAMLAVIGMTEEKCMELIEAAKGKQVLVIANDNADGQIVLSGNEEAVLRAHGLAKEFGAKIAIKLEVSGPFHSPLLEKAAEQMVEELENYDISMPNIPVINNVNAEYYNTKEEIKYLLGKQISARVRWRETMLKMESEGVKMAIEVGAGKVLCGLFNRTCKNIVAVNAENSEEIEKLLPMIA